MQDAENSTTPSKPAEYSTTKPTKDQVREIIAGFATSSLSWKKYCESVGFDYSAAYAVISNERIPRDNPDSLYGLFLRAGEEKAHLMASEVIDIADNTTGTDPRHNVNRIKSRQWLASAYNRKVYGNAIKVEAEGAIVHVYKPQRVEDSNNSDKQQTSETQVS